jgi:hypothetical protein
MEYIELPQDNVPLVFLGDVMDGAYFLNIGDTYIDKGLQMIPQQVAYKMISEVKIR